MGKENVLKDRSFAFAVQLVNLCKELQESKEYVISKQLLRSGTAIGALIREAEFAQSKADFIHKLHISLKEANESSFWLDLLKETNYITDVKHEELMKQLQELIKLLIASIKTAKKN